MPLVEAAEQLGANKYIMDSYWKYHKRKQNWFFSPNPNLEGAARKPSFPSANTWKKLNSKERKKKWSNLSMKQRMTISTLAGFGHEGKGINLDSMKHFSKLREACVSRWPTSVFSIFWSDSSSGKRWLCNVFVGDAIYLYNRSSFTSSNKHYFDPSLTHNGDSTLKKRNDDDDDVKEGDIVVFGTTHIEIITSIQKNSFFDDEFCSMGAGRGVNRKQVGSGDWGWGAPYIGGSREIEDNNNNTYFYI